VIVRVKALFKDSYPGLQDVQSIFNHGQRAILEPQYNTGRACGTQQARLADGPCRSRSSRWGRAACGQEV